MRITFTSNYEKFIDGAGHELDPCKFEDHGTFFNAKLIGVQIISKTNDLSTCLDALYKLKTLIRIRGEHKQKVRLNFTMNAVNIRNIMAGILLASHLTKHISYVVLDPRDARTFGYVHTNAKNEYEFWAIKTEQAAIVCVQAMKDLFQINYYNNISSQNNEINPIPETSMKHSEEIQGTYATSIAAAAQSKTEQAENKTDFDDPWQTDPFGITRETSNSADLAYMHSHSISNTSNIANTFFDTFDFFPPTTDVLQNTSNDKQYSMFSKSAVMSNMNYENESNLQAFCGFLQQENADSSSSIPKNPSNHHNFFDDSFVPAKTNDILVRPSQLRPTQSKP